MCENKKKYYTQKVTDVMKDLGMSPGLSGYEYIRYMIVEELETHEIISQMMASYDKCGREFNISGPSVERNIRHCIDHTLQHGNDEAIQRVFGSCVDSSSRKMPTKTFLAGLVDYIKVYVLDE